MIIKHTSVALPLPWHSPWKVLSILISEVSLRIKNIFCIGFKHNIIADSGIKKGLISKWGKVLCHTVITIFCIMRYKWRITSYLYKIVKNRLLSTNTSIYVYTSWPPNCFCVKTPEFSTILISLLPK